MQQRSEELEATRVAGNYMGTEMQAGLNLNPAKAHIRKLQGQREHKKAGLVEAVAAAGLWLPYR